MKEGERGKLYGYQKSRSVVPCTISSPTYNGICMNNSIHKCIDLAAWHRS